MGELKKVKDGKQNIFEEVIDNLMAEGLDIPSDFIEDLPVEEKREFILNCLIPEEGPTINEMFKNIKCSKTRSEHLKNSIETIKEFIKVGKQEVKKYGEVYTPITLVQEMLDTLPKDVWSNPDLKWLDPANGMGNFPLVVIVRLMKGLKDWEPDVEKRYKHIIENMVYVSELQPRNCFIYLSLVDPNDEYDVNLYCGSFLDDAFNEHMKDVWGLDKFGVVYGNPPYNEEFSNSGTAKDLFDKFIFKSSDISDLILMITPSRWFSKGNLKKLRKILLNTKYIKTFEKSSDVFKGTEITGGVSYFLYERNRVGKTNFNGFEVSLKEQIELFGCILYDQSNYDLVSNIVKKTNSESKLNCFNSKGYFGIKTNNIQNKGDINCFYSNQKGIKYNMLKNKDGRYYSKVNDFKDSNSKLNKWKVITSSAYGANPKGLGKISIINPNDICSESFIFFDFESHEESKNFINFLDSKLVKFLISLRKNKQDVTSKVFELVPQLNFKKQWDNDKLKKHFNITDKEWEFIESII